MKIAIVGAGFTGLSAAYRLIKQKHTVSLFERDAFPGGLALGFQEPSWEWSLEKHYHHWFTNDKSVLELAQEINYPVLIKRPKTSVYVDEKMYQLDSPLNVLKFPRLLMSERIRMAAFLGLLRYNPLWHPLEGIRVTDCLPACMGKRAYKILWEPLMTGKFGPYARDISLAWFWARIKKRTPSLAYPEGGFLPFAQALTKKIEETGGKVFFNHEVNEIKKNREDITLFCFNDLNHSIKQHLVFDKVIVTLPSFFFLNIAPDLPDNYRKKLLSLKGLGAINLILRLKDQFLTDGTYWLNICEKDAPILAIVEHTNFMDRKHYNNEHIVYLGNYLPHDHPYFRVSAEELLKIYDPFLKRINPTYRLSLIAYHLFKVPFAQPIIPINYSKIIPKFETPLKNVYLANIQQVYPWDRGTNYAVELGEKIAEIVQSD